MERPILFSTPMVLAILNGNKTQTRRIVKPQPLQHFRKDDSVLIYERTPGNWEVKDKNSNDGFSRLDSFKCPYGSIGDVLWVRETWQQDGADFFFKADCDINVVGWKPSIHMPKDASRIWLQVVNVRVERLEDIGSADCINEGISKTHLGWKNYDGSPDWFSQPRDSFKSLWQSINGEQSWESNPWVWVIEFKRINK